MAHRFDLKLDGLPSLPQIATLERVAAALWRRDEVAALWLGGSFARGEADKHSDLDLRVAISDNNFDAWSYAQLSDRIGEVVAGGSQLGWDGTMLYHLVLASGVILDLLIQNADCDPPRDATLVLGCRDDAFSALLAQAYLPAKDENVPADPAAVEQAVIDFWIGSHKHAKMLHRGLDLLVLIGLGLEQAALLRMWYIAATGFDQGTQRATIHALTPIVRVVSHSQGSRALETLGMPRTTLTEIIQVIALNRDEMALVGRQLAEAIGFAYPDALERTVRDTWGQYLSERAEN